MKATGHFGLRNACLFAAGEKKTCVVVFASSTECQRIRAELELHRRMDEVKTLATKNRALQDDVLTNRGYTLKMLRFFETKAKVGE